MPSTIVPEAQEIRATATTLLQRRRTIAQIRHNRPKHFPATQTQALLFAVVEFTKQAERQQQELNNLRELQAAQNASFIAELEAWEAEEDGRLFLETCAAEHSFREILR